MMSSIFKRLFLFMVVAFVLVACSQSTRHKILSTFFDGVPEPESAEPQSIAAIDTTAEFASEAAARAHKSEDINFHPPFEERACDACHDFQLSLASLRQQKDLCFSCHDDFTDSLAYVHGPVGGGFCTQCHHPHKSKNEKLLKRTGQDLCLYCHERNEVLAKESHEGLEEENCTDCHNPHGGEDPYFFY